MSNFAVSFAVKEEAAPFLRRLSRIRRFSLEGVEFAVGELSKPRADGRCVVFLTGMGRRAAEKASLALFKHFAPRFLVVSGTTGAVRAGMRPGDLLVADNVGEEGLVALARRVLGPGDAACRVHYGILKTVDHVVGSAAEKRDIARGTEIYGIDMETAVLARTAREANCPVLGLRAVSDGPDETLPVNFNNFIDREGNLRLPPLVLHLLLRPPVLWETICFGGRVRAASRNLAFAVEKILLSQA